MKDSYELFNKYSELNNLRTEGESGVNSLRTLVKDLGYNERGTYLGADPILNFLADNPGAIEKLYDFVQEWVGRNEEWNEALNEAVEEGGYEEKEEK